jgi:hypothetical protein
MNSKNLHFLLITFVTFNFQLSTYNLQAQVNFSPTVNISVGTLPTSVTSDDFNGDGKADLAVGNLQSRNVSVLLGNGTGGFGSAKNFSTGNSCTPYSLISKDFNGDSKTDLAIANSYAATFVLLFGDGTGNFNSMVTETLGGSSQSIISDDFNGDSKADIAVTDNSNHVSIHLGDGAGGFSTNTNYAVGKSDGSVISGDFNGDGKADLAVSNAGSNNVSVLLGQGIGYLGAVTNFSVGASPGSIISTDFNGDGKVDLATANQNSNNVSVLLGDGTGNFAPATNFTAGNGSRSIISADFNGDGFPDLAVANIVSGDVSILAGDGTGHFGIATNFTVGVNPFSIITEDFNSDGKPDLAIANFGSDNISILLNNTPSYTPTPSLCMVTVDPTDTHNVVVWDKTNMATVDSIIIFREISTNNYQPIGTVSSDSLSAFDDYAANPATTGYRYKLKSKNSDGTESAFSNYHNTIYLTSSGGNFSWTPYQIENNITPVSIYNIFRDDNSTGNFVLIGYTTGNQFGFTDTQITFFPNASYYVEAVMAGGACNPTRARASYEGSRSNIKHFGINGVQQLNSNPILKIYPNPSANTLNITGIKEKTTIRFYDLYGKLVLEKETESNTMINTRSMTPGVYMLLTESKAGRTFNKVSINH